MRALVFLIGALLLAACEPKWVKNERLYDFSGVWENQNKLLVFSFISKGNSNSFPRYSLFSDSTLYNTCYNFPGYKYDSPVVDIQCDNGDLYTLKKTGSQEIQLKGPFITLQEEAGLDWEKYVYTSSMQAEDWVKDHHDDAGNPRLLVKSRRAIIRFNPYFTLAWPNLPGWPSTSIGLRSPGLTGSVQL